MKHPWRTGLLVALGMGFVSYAGAATGIPDPSHCVVPDVVYDPAGAFTYEVTVRDALDQPCTAVQVDVVFSPTADALVCWCAGQIHPVISSTTDSNGKAIFVIYAGGCLDPAFVGSPTIEVFANGVKIGDVGGISPDVVDAGGLLPWDGWDESGGCVVGLADAVYHANPIKYRIYSFCTDMNADGKIGLLDAVLFTPPLRLSNSCTP